MPVDKLRKLSGKQFHSQYPEKKIPRDQSSQESKKPLQ